MKKNQLDKYIKYLRGKVDTKMYLVQQIVDYWEYKENNEYTLTEASKKRIESFLNTFTVEKIQEAIDIAFAKPNLKDEERYKYFSGIINNWKKEKDIPPEATEIKKYWNYKRPQIWKNADDGKVLYLAETFDLTKIKYYIDCLVDEEKGWADFDSLIGALKSNKYD